MLSPEYINRRLREVDDEVALFEASVEAYPSNRRYAQSLLALRALKVWLLLKKLAPEPVA